MFPLTAFAAATLAVSPTATLAQAPAGPQCPTTPTTLAAANGLPSPPELRSKDGELRVTLRASGGRTEIGGTRAAGLLFNRSFPSPTIRVCAGDVLHVTFVNDLTKPTNLHTHGLHVTPKGLGDDVFREIKPGQTAQYRYVIPDSHAGGLSWYHPHYHGLTDEQVFRGLAGALVVESPKTDDLPGLAGLPERVVALQAVDVQDGRIVAPSKSTSKGRRVLVNGRFKPTVTLRPGELQRWRVLNASADAFVRLELSGGARLQVTGIDADPLARRTAQDRVLLGPGERRELLIRGPEAGKQVTLRTTSFKQPFVNTREQALVTIRGEGEPVVPAPPLPNRLATHEDLRDAPVSRKRTFRLTSTFPTFRINGRTWSHHRTDTVAALNAVEEWTVRNDSDEWHNFHLHQNPVQVVAVGGKPVDRGALQDTPVVPPRSSITFRVRFADFDGRFVYHCHLLDHEDRGMMGNIEVEAG